MNDIMLGGLIGGYVVNSNQEIRNAKKNDVIVCANYTVYKYHYEKVRYRKPGIMRGHGGHGGHGGHRCECSKITLHCMSCTVA